MRPSRPAPIDVTTLAVRAHDARYCAMRALDGWPAIAAGRSISCAVPDRSIERRDRFGLGDRELAAAMSR